jgi:sodium/hydrogen antiporter
MVSQSLKYMGMGGLIRPSEKANEEEEEKNRASDNDVDPITRVSSRPAMPSWINFGRTTAGEPPAQRQRKKSIAEVQEEEDDRHIRFTIGGVGQRMTKEGFIKQMQQLDQSTRREVVDTSSASHTVKTLAKQDVPLPDIVVSHPDRRARAGSSAAAGRHRGSKEVDGNDGNGNGNEDDSSPRSSTSHLKIAPLSQHSRTVAGPSDNTDDMPETAVERRRRLAVLQSVGDDDDDDDDDDKDEAKETPAERRRREAALGMSSHQAEDSDDDDTPRVPPSRRGIRFADTPDKRQA